MGLRKVLVQSRKLPAQHIEGLWEHIYKNNVKQETVSSILTFYLHHRVYPPPVQKAFDMLLLSFTDAKVSKKMKVLLFQTVEEMCHWLSPSCIMDTVRLSSSINCIVDLLPCFLINKSITLPEISLYERIISSLTSTGLSQEERCKVLGFIMNTIPSELRLVLNKQLISWLSYSRTPQLTGSLFRSVDVTEIDRSPGIGTCTALTLVTTVTDLHMLSLVAFSNMRHYLSRAHADIENDLITAVLSYCSTLLAQAAKKPNTQHDKQLVTAVLEEVLLLMGAVRSADNGNAGRCQLIVQNIQLLAEQLKLTSVLVSVWEYQLDHGEDSPLTQRMLGSVVRSEFSQGHVSQRIASVIAAHASQLCPCLAHHTPNLLKLVATHPSALVEEFLDIMPFLGMDSELVVEILHSILDLPLLSTSICVHQTALLVQAGIRVPALQTAKQLVETDPSNRQVFSHLMRAQAEKDQTKPVLELYFRYLSAVRPILTLGLVEVCSQVTPLLLEVFLDSVSKSHEANKLLVPVLLKRALLLCPLNAYQNAVFDLISQYISKVCTLQPELAENSCIVWFLSVNSHYQLCPKVFNTLVTVVGSHARNKQVIENLFEVLDTSLREMMVDKNNQNTKLKLSICLSLAKLASRHTNLITRAISALEKLCSTVQTSPLEDKDAILQEIKELTRLLKNPRVASVVLSPDNKEDVALGLILRVLFQFLE